MTRFPRAVEKQFSRVSEKLTTSSDRKRCFVIMPFSETSEFHTLEYWNNHYEKFLKPLIDSCTGVEASRSAPLRQDILRQIINDLVFSPIVVADLTDSNPNVFWELGVRLSFRHGTITIADESSKIPFDIKTKGVLFYPSDPNRRDEFSKKFKEAVSDCISNPDRPDSVVLETITGRGSVYSVIHHQENIQRIDGVIAEIEENWATVKAIYMSIDENKKRRLSALRSSWWTIRTSLGHSALDLLLSERYIEEKPEFYAHCHEMLFVLNAINEGLSNWATNRDASKWFTEKEILVKRLFETFHADLRKERQELLLKC